MDLADAKLYCEYISSYICKEEGHEPLLLDFRDIKASWARYDQNLITMSHGWCQYRKQVVFAVMIHEVCHFLHYRDYQLAKTNGGNFPYIGHGLRFKEYERKWLKHFGMRPIYSKAYWHTLTDLNGNVLYDKRYDARSV